MATKLARYMQFLQYHLPLLSKQWNHSNCWEVEL